MELLRRRGQREGERGREGRKNESLRDEERNGFRSSGMSERIR